MKRRLKKSVSYCLYGLALVLLLVGVGLIGMITSGTTTEAYDYVSKGILDEEQEVEVVSIDTTINRPYSDAEVKIVKSYYDYKADAEEQKKSLLFYENTYMQSTGVAYSKGSAFDVISILSGTVTEVTTDETVGNSITIEHDNGITSVYQSIADILVKKGDTVTQGDKIATTSTSNISSKLENHLYFELIVNDECVNPENYYDKKMSEV